MLITMWHLYTWNVLKSTFSKKTPFCCQSEEEVGRLCEFVGYLTTEMHKACPDGLVIWYDSVVTTGKLDWQNALNEHNKWAI